MAQQGVNGRFAAAELHEQLHRISCATLFQDRLEEGETDGPIEDAFFLEAGEGVAGEYLGPFVTGVTGGNTRQKI